MGSRRSWTASQLKSAVKTSLSYRQVIEKLGLRPAGGNYYQLQKYVKEYGLDTSHFKGSAWNKGLKGIGKPRIKIKDILVKGSTFQSYKLKQRLFKENLKPQKCEICGWSERTSTGHLPLEVDHINGDRTDHRLKNLRILCPNCHSLTPNYRYRRGKSKK
ncbi:MAG: HNH endonuclease signature motif containing protein [bacterium]|nr:HNH endonuclease signature motif containing protein [bacterium]